MKKLKKKTKELVLTNTRRYWKTINSGDHKKRMRCLTENHIELFPEIDSHYCRRRTPPPPHYYTPIARIPQTGEYISRKTLRSLRPEIGEFAGKAGQRKTGQKPSRAWAKCGPPSLYHLQFSNFKHFKNGH